MVTERAIELVQERLHEYALFLNDDTVSTITDGASIMTKFGRETEPLHFSCLAHAIHLSACDVLHTEKPKQMSDECCDGGGTGNATANDESDGEENAEEKSDEQECDKEQQNCFDIIPEIKEIIKNCQNFWQISCKKRQFATTSSAVLTEKKKFVSRLQNSLEQFAEYALKIL